MFKLNNPRALLFYYSAAITALIIVSSLLSGSMLPTILMLPLIYYFAKNHRNLKPQQSPLPIKPLLLGLAILALSSTFFSQTNNRSQKTQPPTNPPPVAKVQETNQTQTVLVEITAPNTPLYLQPSETSEPIEELTPGSQLQVTEQINNWYKVDLGNQTGWVHAKNTKAYELR